jgi:hypothetical protein
VTGEIQILTEIIGGAGDALNHLPEPIKRNLWNALGALITGVADVPASYLEMKASEFKVRKQGHEKIMLAAAQGAAEMAGHSKEIADRAMEYFANDLITGQANREAVARETMQAAMTLSPPDSTANVAAIDKDWLDQFRKLASSKSSADIQAILGRILAGEAQQPTSFSAITLDVVAKLDQNIAKIFEYIVSYTLIIPNRNDIVISMIIGADMIKVDRMLDSMTLRHLQSFGLLNASVGPSINNLYFAELPPCTLCGETILFSADETIGPATLFLPTINAEFWPLSLPAMQLAPLLPKTFDRDYARRLRDGMKRIGVTVTFPTINIEEDPAIPSGAAPKA